jgi:hypothetical protein
MKTRIHNWRFHDGITPINPGHPLIELVPPRGWYCWAYPDDGQEFGRWMGLNCPGADVTWRFNSGDPMFTVFIQSDSEAQSFKTQWIQDEKEKS